MFLEGEFSDDSALLLPAGIAGPMHLSARAVAIVDPADRSALSESAVPTFAPAKKADSFHRSPRSSVAMVESVPHPDGRDYRQVPFDAERPATARVLDVGEPLLLDLIPDPGFPEGVRIFVQVRLPGSLPEPQDLEFEGFADFLGPVLCWRSGPAVPPTPVADPRLGIRWRDEWRSRKHRPSRQRPATWAHALFHVNSHLLLHEPAETVPLWKQCFPFFQKDGRRVLLELAVTAPLWKPCFTFSKRAAARPLRFHGVSRYTTFTSVRQILST